MVTIYHMKQIMNRRALCRSYGGRYTFEVNGERLQVVVVWGAFMQNYKGSDDSGEIVVVWDQAFEKVVVLNYRQKKVVDKKIILSGI